MIRRLVAWASPAGPRARLSVLIFHRVRSERDAMFPDELDAAGFDRLCTWVRRWFDVRPLDEAVQRLRSGTLPARAAAITFDDGYADNHRLGLPVLRELGLPATVYVATGAIADAAPFWVAAVRALALGVAHALPMPDGPAQPVDGAASRTAAAKALTRALVPIAAEARAAWLADTARTTGVDVVGTLAGTMLDWAQIRELATAGWTIGAHTVTHSNVALIEPARAEREIAESRDALAAAIGAPVHHFCYPNSGGQHTYFGPAVTDILRKLDFRSATTSRPGALAPGADPFLLPRLGVSPRLADVPELATAMERQRLAA